MADYPFAIGVGGALTGTLPSPTLSQAWAPTWIPGDSGLLSASASLEASAGSFLLIAGTVYLAKIPVRSPFAITNIAYIVRTAGLGASTGSFVGVYNPSGTLLSTSADIGANLLTAGDYSTALSTPQSAATIGALAFIWVAVVVNLATTQPTWNAWASTTFTIPNLGLTAATMRSGTAGTGLTSLPASITPASNTPAGSTLWFGTS